jgi:4-hydroxy-3-polyprenylbenzoate decarboxylase
MAEAVRNAIAPVTVPRENAPCQQTEHLASDPDFDLRKLIPAPTNTTSDAGPFLCLGLVLGSDPDTGHADVTIHRLCVQGRDELSIFFAPGRHIDAFRQKAEARGEALPVSINMGLDPAIHIGACFEAPTTPLGFDELSIAGGLRGTPVELVDCVSVAQKSIARAEIVIEGEILPDVRVVEDQNTHTGHAMPEFPGYNGPANPSLPVIKVKAVTMRQGAIMQTLVGPGEEHTNLAGIPTEASIYNAVEAAMPGFVSQVYAHTAGGGKLLAVMQVNKRNAFDDGRARQAALIALGVYSELKHVILVDEDVDPFDSDDVLWAMTTRYQGDVSAMVLPKVNGHVLDPSQTPDFNPALPARGVTCKVVFDCTAPFHLRGEFERAKFMEVDPRPWAPSLFDDQHDQHNQHNQHDKAGDDHE